VRNEAPDAKVIQLVLPGTKANLDIAKTLAKSELAESHTQELIPTREGFDFVVTSIALDTSPKLLRVDGVHELSEDKFSGVHPESLAF